MHALSTATMLLSAV